MSSTQVSNYDFKGGLSPRHNRRDSTRQWERERAACTRGEHNHTPPIGHISRPGDGYRYLDNGLRTPPPSNRRMCNEVVSHSLAPSIGGQLYVKAQIVASNAPPHHKQHHTQQSTVDSSGTTSHHRPFYDTYPSARRPLSPVPCLKDIAAQNEDPPRRRDDGNSIASHLQIPSSINDSEGSLPEFAAQVRNWTLPHPVQSN